eukprot:jgi/Mesen1/356/ME000001S02665
MARGHFLVLLLVSALTVSLLPYGIDAKASAQDPAPDQCPMSINKCKKADCDDKNCGTPNKYISFSSIAMNAGGSAVASASECCTKCRTTAGCVYWQYDKNPVGWWLASKKRKLLSNGDVQGNDGLGNAMCYLMGGNQVPKCARAQYASVTSITRVGGKCNPSVNDDPHFVGAQGTRYDFNGEPNAAFCLVSDKSLHINMLLKGYLDNRTEGATVMKDGKAVRTWIRELGIKWTAAGQEHSLRLAARSGKQQERGSGFLAGVEMDGASVAPLAVGSKFVADGGLEIAFVGFEKSGPFDVDFYTVKIAGLLSMDMRLRVAHPLLQTPEDAEVHINAGFNSIENTPAVHGVLGQTYRADHTQRAVSFSKLTALLHAPIAADGESGKGFLDGTPQDYVSSDILSTDCRFSTYQGATAAGAADNAVSAL